MDQNDLEKIELTKEGFWGRIERFCPKSFEIVNQSVNFAERDEKEFKRQVTVYGDYFMKDIS